ncbi:hypothetical protein D9758_008167 [Tetrapyrgos nigripes]|uniref:Uncharacterized protein n=1 Tax=Tetrapyrgos nigripes TaxID=182062 RepID=A0A8H5GH68_9AGAR|nr:hypothetical protein D9758_008167 [Tetrapyrgos nigripes]
MSEPGGAEKVNLNKIMRQNGYKRISSNGAPTYTTAVFGEGW